MKPCSWLCIDEVQLLAPKPIECHNYNYKPGQMPFFLLSIETCPDCQISRFVTVCMVPSRFRYQELHLCCTRSTSWFHQPNILSPKKCWISATRNRVSCSRFWVHSCPSSAKERWIELGNNLRNRASLYIQSLYKSGERERGRRGKGKEVKRPCREMHHNYCLVSNEGPVRRLSSCGKPPTQRDSIKK